MNTDCQKFDAVGHVAHLDAAINIIRDGKIKPGLVFDHSRLNKSRTLVSWASPNYWSNGYRYGNVRFDFNFRDLVERKRYYWVEAIDYQPAACRILITDQDYAGLLTPYDPQLHDGPWRFDSSSNIDYYNGDFCLEFMFEQEIELAGMCDLSFVDHHSKFCSIYRSDPGRCDEKGEIGGRAGATFLGKVTAGALDLSAVAQYWVQNTGELSNQFIYGLSFVARRVTHNCKFVGNLTASNQAAISVARAIMNAMAIGHKDEIVALASMFQSETDLLQTVANLINDSLGLSKSAEILRALTD
ncbi:hypothetical protein [Burkholderia reimsis]|uniref:hypothetical protein n=1 Tax=Burkholderia reimsis TaxID=2234132 RepID=UPI001058DAD1|nr:hypothetical protein [Burkholderia reimsis]